VGHKVGHEVGQDFNEEIPMAIPQEFIHTMPELKGLKANKTYTKFRYRFKIEDKEYVTTLDYSDKNWDKKTRKSNATVDAINYKKKKSEWDMDFTLDTSFGFLAEEYMKNKWDMSTKWSQEKRTMLHHYIYPWIKDKKASAIKERDIDKIRKNMEQTGHAKQNRNGSSPRTIRKVLLQVLKPILEYGMRNGALKKMPEIDVPPKPPKKEVTNGTEQLATLYNSIMTLYEKNPFYRALFLFALFGRRWNEIRTLEWRDIDFTHSQYTIRKENSKINKQKTFMLPDDIRMALLEFKSDRRLVFVSPVTGRELSLPKVQIRKLKQASGIEELTLHYFRHIMATALSDVGMVGTVLSASLGHENMQTVDNYYRTANTLKGSREATQAIEHILDIQ